MGANGPPFQPMDVYLAQQGKKPCVISRAKNQYNGPHLFWASPSQFDWTTERIQVFKPTRNGGVRFSTGYKPTLFTLVGCTFSGGIVELTDQAHGMGYFQPQFGRNDQIYYFTFPMYRLWDIPVYIDLMKRSSDAAQAPNYFNYEIHLEQLPPAKPSYSPVSAQPSSQAANNAVVASGGLVVPQ